MATKSLSAATTDKMTPFHWAARPILRYADFNGRAPRAEYWWYALATTIAAFGFDFLDKFFGGPLIGAYGPLSLVLTFGLLIPGLAVEIRRLHDIDRSGWWILLNLWSYGFVVAGLGQMPVEGIFKSVFKDGHITALVIFVLVMLVMLIGTVILFVFSVTHGTEGPNRYGPDPYGRDRLEEAFA